MRFHLDTDRCFKLTSVIRGLSNSTILFQHSVDEGNGVHHGAVETVDGSCHTWKTEELADGRTKVSIVSTPKFVMLEERYLQNFQRLQL
jgi:hypothetical protein